MSLINDALRRASEEDRAQAEPPPPPNMGSGPLLDPVEPPPISPWPSLIGLLAVVIVVGGGLGAGGWFYWKSRQARAAALAAANAAAKLAPATVSAKSPAATAATPAPAAAAVSNTTIYPATNAIAAGPPVVPPAGWATNVIAVRPLTPVNWPQLKLQGIYYKPPKSSVMINGKTLFLSDEILGVTIAEIGTYFVIITQDGQSNTLVLR